MNRRGFLAALAAAPAVAGAAALVPDPAPASAPPRRPITKVTTDTMYGGYNVYSTVGRLPLARIRFRVVCGVELPRPGERWSVEGLGTVLVDRVEVEAVAPEPEQVWAQIEGLVVGP